jgi:hypothetical protein
MWLIVPISVFTQSTGSRPKTEQLTATTAAKVYILFFMLRLYHKADKHCANYSQK